MITLLVVQGLERGNLYSDLNPPITIGREEDNTIQLNDERISRCHVKLQHDGDKVILTDLESTNGTRVNGLPVKMSVLRPGDLISLGRSVLLFGSREEIRLHCHQLHQDSLREIDPELTNHPEKASQTISLFDEHGQPVVPFPQGRPPLPTMSGLLSKSELSDLLSYIHTQILFVLESRGINQPEDKGSSREAESFARIPWELWFHLLDLEADLSHYLREIPEPD